MHSALDCTDVDTALSSVAVAFATKPTEVAAAIDEVDLDAACELEDYDGNPNRALMKALVSRLKRQPTICLDEVRWFHLTRVPLNIAFEEGILPLSQSLTNVWSTLLSIFEGHPQHMRLKELQLEGVPNFQYQHKVGKPHLAGPYAMLVRESAFRAAEMGNHDYLGLPEIVEDICNGYQDRFSEDIAPAVRAALRPCIVTFRSPRYTMTLLEAATRYVYAVRHGDQLSVWANHVFDGANRPVHRGSIVGIDYVE